MLPYNPYLRDMGFQASELIYREDGGIYHLALRPEEIARRIFLVGDPDRVAMVSRFFDEVELRRSHREFVTHTGRIGGQRLSVISTGIGTDNVDIVVQELDILANVDPVTRQPRNERLSLELIRLGTSGAYQEDIRPGNSVLSQHAIGLDTLLHFYQAGSVLNSDLQAAFRRFADARFRLPVNPYAADGDPRLIRSFAGLADEAGITLTLPGFYGPQGRRLRAPLFDDRIWSALPEFRWRERRITNFEMESSGLYGLAALLGHRALSLNLILANRLRGEFLSSPESAMSSMIGRVLSNLPEG